MSGCQSCSFSARSTAVENGYVGVRVGEAGSLVLCATRSEIFNAGEEVVVELDTGPVVAQVEKSPMPIFKPCQKASAKRVLRRATEEDRSALERQRHAEAEAKRFCQERSRGLGLEMKLSKVSFSLDGKAATVYFTAEGRVDFRRLVREMSRRFSAKVRMVQVGTRDEAGLLGGIGVCGRELCCSSWLKDFKPISIQMAKRQNLSLNPSKISGQCGRLLCCLAYEDERYREGSSSRKAN